MTTTSVTTVAAQLSSIVQMFANLHEEAEDKATAKVDGMALPGGFAMVALAPVANIEAWEAQYETREHFGRDVSHVEDEDDSTEPPLQVLRFWTDRYRRIHSAEWDHIPTVNTEANFLKHMLNWAWENEADWDHLASDVARAKTRLENLLRAGERAERGVPCLYDECRGVRIVRKLVPSRAEDGSKTWTFTDWHCPRCKRSWNAERYAAMVTAAHERTKFEEIDGETWASLDFAAKRVQRGAKTIETWANRGELSTICLIAGKRVRFVNIDEVIALDQNKKRRNRVA